MACHVGAKAIKEAFEALGWPFSLRQVKHMIAGRVITAFKVGPRLLATTDEDIGRDVERWRSSS